MLEPSKVIYFITVLKGAVFKLSKTPTLWFLFGDAASYATRASPTYGQYRHSKSVSKSRSPSPFEGGIKFITSFGDEEDSDPAGKSTNSRSPTKNRDKDSSNRRPFTSTSSGARDRGGRSSNSGREATKVRDRRHSRSRSTDRRARSPSPSRIRKDKRPGTYYRKERSRSRSRRRSRSPRHRRSRSRSRSRRRSRHSRSRSRSHSPRNNRRHRDRSLSRYLSDIRFKFSDLEFSHNARYFNVLEGTIVEDLHHPHQARLLQVHHLASQSVPLRLSAHFLWNRLGKRATSVHLHYLRLYLHLLSDDIMADKKATLILLSRTKMPCHHRSLLRLILQHPSILLLSFNQI